MAANPKHIRKKTGNLFFWIHGEIAGKHFFCGIARSRFSLNQKIVRLRRKGYTITGVGSNREGYKWQSR